MSFVIGFTVLCCICLLIYGIEFFGYKFCWIVMDFYLFDLFYWILSFYCVMFLFCVFSAYILIEGCGFLLYSVSIGFVHLLFIFWLRIWMGFSLFHWLRKFNCFVVAYGFVRRFLLFIWLRILLLIEGCGFLLSSASIGFVYLVFIFWLKVWMGFFLFDWLRKFDCFVVAYGFLRGFLLFI